MVEATFSIIIPIYNPNKQHLQECLSSVFDQTISSDFWELILVHDLDGHQLSDLLDPKILDLTNVRSFESSQHLGISCATNKGGELAEHEYLILLDQDDLLDHNALETLKHLIESSHERPALLHSDYRLISESGEPIENVETPNYSPIRLLALMYPVHLKIVRKDLWQELDGYNSELDGSQDHDFYLRAITHTDLVRVAHVIYSWRASEKSSQSNPDAKPLAPLKTRLAVETHLEKLGYNFRLKLANPHPALYQVDILANKKKPISVVIPTAFSRIDGKVSLEILLKSIERTSNGREVEIICVINPADEKYIYDLENEIEIRWVRHSDLEFNYSRAVNAGVEATKFENLLILNDDMEFISEDWIDTLNGFLDFPGIGIIGAKLFFPSGSVQHAGIGITDSGHCYHILYNTRGVIGALGEGVINHEVDAVTGAFMGITRKNWIEFGGLMEKFPGNYNDVAICLKAWNFGKRVVQVNSIELIHHESLSRTPTRTEQELKDFDDFLREFPKIGKYTLTSENLHQNLRQAENTLGIDQITGIVHPRLLARIKASMKHRGILGAIKNYLAI